MLRTGGVAPGRRGDAGLRRRRGAQLLQMRVADFLVKPVQPLELVRTCARVARANAAETAEAQIYTFMPAVGGAGVTTLAIQTALMLLNSGQRGKPTTCLVDLDFQHGACADYLDLEPRLDLKEIEPRPERLDRQLLEIMLSHHPSGPRGDRRAEPAGRDAHLRSRYGDAAARSRVVALRLCRHRHAAHLVLVDRQRAARLQQAVHRQRNDGAEPEQAKGLVGAIRERLGDGPQPQVIVNRFEQRMFDAGPEEVRSRAGARARSPAPSRTTTAWCARRSTAAFRSMRSSPATTSRAAQEADAAAGGRQGAGRRRQGLMKRLSLSLAK